MEHEKKHHHDNAEENETSELTSELQNKTHRKRKIKPSHSLAIVVIILVIAVGGALVWLYTGNLSSAKEKVFSAIPLPAALVDSKFISAKSVIDRVALSAQLLEAQGVGDQANPETTYNQILDVKKLEAVAGNKNVTATDDEINEEYQNIIIQYAEGNEEAFREELNATYQMTPDEFKSEVIRQQVTQSNLMLWYNQQEDLNRSAFDKAKELQEKITNGESFDDVAKAYTQDEATKDFAGDSGMLAYEDLLPEFRDALTEAKTGDTQIVASRYGLHYLKVLDRNNNGENGADQIHLQQIFVKLDGFSEWIKQETENVNVIQFLKFA